jgi:hypothetical protein
MPAGCNSANESARQKPDAACDGSATPCAKDVKITSIMINSIQFLSDHRSMKNNESDYKDTGVLYPLLHWQAGKQIPLSHNSTGTIEIDVEIEVKPSGAIPETGNLVCVVEGNEWFRKNGINFSSGVKKIRLKSGTFTTKFIALKALSFNWKAEKVSVPVSPSSTNHTVAFTLDKPHGYEDSGITKKRLYESVKLLQPLALTDSHRIVQKLMKRLEFYVLSTNPAVPSKYRHPTYYNTEGGAWPMMDYLSYYGECQAIVRFVGDVIKQVGAPGSIEQVYVYAAPASPKIAKEDAAGGLGNYPGYALVDKPVERDRTYPPSHTLEGGVSSVGFNNYEACLKFTDRGLLKYYGGGTGGAAFDTKQEVLKVFSALVKFEGAWYPNAADPRRVMGYKVTKILATQIDW